MVKDAHRIDQVELVRRECLLVDGAGHDLHVGDTRSFEAPSCLGRGDRRQFHRHDVSHRARERQFVVAEA